MKTFATGSSVPRAVATLPETPQVADPERRLLAHVPAGCRLALLDASEALASALRSAGCEVLAVAVDDGARPSERACDEVTQFGPSRIVLADAGRRKGALGSTLHALERAARGAELVVAFWNGSAANALLAALSGRRWDHAIVPDEEVRSVLKSHGLSIASREPATWSTEPFLAGDVDRALRQVFAQLNPSAEDDWVVYVARRPVEAVEAARDLVDGLLSVVVRNHSLDRLQLVDETIFSLACQSYAPMEIVLVTQCPDSNAASTLEQLLARHQRVGNYVFQIIARPCTDDIRGKLLNIGIGAARGRYLAFLDDDDVVYPHHYKRLIGALQKGSSAWSVAQTRRSWFTYDPTGLLYCKSKDMFSPHERFSLSDLVRENYIPAHSYVLDRERLGRFPIAFAEDVTRCEDYIFLLKLAACFRPIFLAAGPSCEYRVRDDGSNSNMMADQPEEVRARELVTWNAARAVKDAVKRKLHLLVSMVEYEQDVQRAFALGHVQQPIRYRAADWLNEFLKRVAPGTRVRLRSTTDRVLAWAARRRKA